MERLKRQIHSLGLAGVYLYGISLIISKGGVNIGLALMTLSAICFVKDLKIKEIEIEYKIFLIILLFIPIFDLLSPGGLYSARVTIKQLYRFLPMFIAPIFLKTTKELKRFMYMISISVLINCLNGINFYRKNNYNFTLRYESFTTIMDSAHALVGLSFIILSLIIIEVKNRKNNRLIYLIPTYLLNLFCIILGQTRGAWLALIAGFLIYLSISLTKKQLLMSSIMVLILIGFSFNVIKDNPYVKRFQSITDVKNLSPKTRLFMWEASLDIYRNNTVFGVGKDNGPKYYLDYFEKNDLYSKFDEWDRPMVKVIATAGNAHNMYFENLVNMGVLFFALLGFWIFILYKSFIQTRKFSKKGELYWISLAATSMILVYYVTGLTEGAWGEFIKRHIYLIGVILYISCKKNGVFNEKI
ncbi:O-antigen ligase family protein [Cetobacterium somerae]|uniref:O-antigen ligase family protein n=1 Tax=Cetobacterium somerae TaxID=188913 RepID=UPI001F05C39C|nr:O-antigen ligase family protein [Cetobacterium somerae]UPO97394.1 O-antigen ligase family protein [Cetobacterium somerae]